MRASLKDGAGADLTGADREEAVEKALADVKAATEQLDEFIQERPNFKAAAAPLRSKLTAASDALAPKPAPPQTPTTPPVVPGKGGQKPPPAGYKRFVSKAGRHSFDYPSGWKLQESRTSTPLAGGKPVDAWLATVVSPDSGAAVLDLYMDAGRKLSGKDLGDAIAGLSRAWARATKSKRETSPDGWSRSTSATRATRLPRDRRSPASRARAYT
ncbi:MAG: hypothetical protein WKH64_16910 [Chloroflexia bacterium]